MELASEVLKGDKKVGDTGLTMAELEAGVIAKIIDVVQANHLFHLCFSRWLAGGPFELAQLPKEDALVYTMKQYERFTKVLPTIGLNAEVSRVASRLLVEQLRRVVAFWDDVPVDRFDLIPVETRHVFREKLEWARHELAGKHVENELLSY